jgi:uncharacterized protein
MRRESGILILSATDLSNFLNCQHRTALEIGEALGKRRRPAWNDPLLEALFARGVEHERKYVASLRAAGKTIIDLTDTKVRSDALVATLEAMRSGTEVIVQGALGSERWYGRPDVLLRVAEASALGDWGYEIADTKLAIETRAGTILQVGLYCDLLANVQGRPPEHFYVVTPDGQAPVKRYRSNEYAAYFRLLRRQLEAAVLVDEEALAATHYPEPIEHCDVCPWTSECSHKRRQEDHLSLVAGITRVQRTELRSHDIKTMAALAHTPIPFPFRPTRGSIESYVRVREQARVQVRARELQASVFELIQPVEPGKGLTRLPAPSAGDLFFDIEGDPFAGENGREYLFGIASLAEGGHTYTARWALNEADEATAFNDVISTIMDAWAAHPEMHVYHYAPYEPAALKRLMGRFAQCEKDIDTLLRGERFVDLYAVVRQGLRAGVERYSIKSLEPLFAFARQVPLLDANRSLRVMEQALEMDVASLITPEVRQTIQGYNEDDCVSALRLRNWLETLRSELEAQGQAIPRPHVKEGEASEKVNEREQRVAELRARLLDGVPLDRGNWSPDQNALWILAYLLDWHRREDKAVWWEYFRLLELAEEDLFDEPQAIAGLEFVERVEMVLSKKGKPTGSVVDSYRYPIQEMEVRGGDELKLRTEEKWGDVVRVSRVEHFIDVRKGPRMADVHPTSAFEHKYISTEVMEDAIFAIGVAIARREPATLAMRLLRAEPPATGTSEFARRQGERTVDFAVRTGLDLVDSVLAIQGPPGAGKTFTGAEMICALVGAGRRVGVTATGHAVIRNLLDAVAERTDTLRRSDIRLGHKVDEPENAEDPVLEFKDNEPALNALQSGKVNVLGGTPWLWSRPEFAKSVDVLFVDEAGQMSLANVLAVSQAARNIVLLGDQQQLEQPKKGTHPEGVGVSALQHILGANLTMPERLGVFLDETWRLSPAIASFTSEVFYEGRLRSKPGLERQRLVGTPFAGSGLWTLDVAHQGNRNASDEEVHVVDNLVTTLLASGSRWVDELAVEHQIQGDDILVVAPFNAQVARLAERLTPRGIKIGTVDKFQGQEAPVVIYSMATSQPEDAPRGLEFLYSMNRLNVATSRARCAVFIVANPQLYEPDCRTPRQIRLANALCRYRELATAMTEEA